MQKLLEMDEISTPPIEGNTRQNCMRAAVTFDLSIQVVLIATSPSPNLPTG